MNTLDTMEELFLYRHKTIFDASIHMYVILIDVVDMDLTFPPTIDIVNRRLHMQYSKLQYSNIYDKRHQIAFSILIPADAEDIIRRIDCEKNTVKVHIRRNMLPQRDNPR